MKKTTQTEQPVLLPNVTWQKFEMLLAELGQDRTVRLTYDRNKLEMLTPLPERDRCNKLIESLILLLANELGISVESCLPLLIKGSEQGCAVDVDGGYYIQYPVPDDGHLADLPHDDPPDLAVEIVITKSTFDKLSLYAELGIPEVWRYLTQAGDDVLNGNLLIYQLQGDRYIEHGKSAIFPGLPAIQIIQFIQQSDAIGLVQALQLLRAWIQEKQEGSRE
ncbi:Uma2 family endonuclease [Oscillatoria sp. FACHB-1407]|uniref:Uma2 family endonuclease n=1 Tax=Oscillatoria sp. FACHB-1407 TaxID=2692847 RepID=UPI0016828FB8|nr:Uma2 family endonuclease [Oscillatoria sp. FACHB-1407]MBD2462192.1 Uma2 family endonuclease [Oscillatoria sp. FACHB-1407]